MRQYARVLIRVAATHVVPYAGGGVRVHKLPNGVAIQEQRRVYHLDRSIIARANNVVVGIVIRVGHKVDQVARTTTRYRATNWPRVYRHAFLYGDRGASAVAYFGLKTDGPRDQGEKAKTGIGDGGLVVEKKPRKWYWSTTVMDHTPANVNVVVGIWRRHI